MIRKIYMMKNNYDITKSMLYKIRTFGTEKGKIKSLQEQITDNQNEYQDNNQDNSQNKYEKDNVDNVNGVDVKLNSSDNADLNLTDEQKTVITNLIDSFKQEVSQIAELDPGFSMTPGQIRLDGYLEDQDLKFVFIAGNDSGVYIIAEMLKLEQDIAMILEKLTKYQLTFESALEPLISYRKNN